MDTFRCGVPAVAISAAAAEEAAKAYVTSRDGRARLATVWVPIWVEDVTCLVFAEYRKVQPQLGHISQGAVNFDCARFMQARVGDGARHAAMTIVDAFVSIAQAKPTGCSHYLLWLLVSASWRTR